MEASYIGKGIIEIIWEDFLDDIPPGIPEIMVDLIMAQKIIRELEGAAEKIREAMKEGRY